MVPQRRRPPQLSGRDPGDPKAIEAPLTQLRGPPWSQSKGGSLASAAGSSVIPKRRRLPRLSGGCLGGLKAKEAPSPQRRRLRVFKAEEAP